MPPFRKQSEEPLYPKALWNRPVARSAGGRILIVGGHRGDFSLPTAIHQIAEASGAGQIKVALPDVLRPLLAGAPDVEFLPSSPSGSLGRAALGELIDFAEDANAVVLAGLSNNSETTILVEGLVRETNRGVILLGDAIESLKHALPDLASSSDTLIIVTLPELFKIANVLGLPTKITRTDLAGQLQIIQSIAMACQASFLIYGQGLIAAVGSELVVTEAGSEIPESALAGVAATFWVQNSDRMTALATASFILGQTSGSSTTEQAKAIRKILADF
jgi:NAD(P)H-hydrate repair Nnr-like enzyme with NAD(P)H-hydrate dehydratase domain